MRALFLLLLLANLAFFAWAHYLARPDSGSDPLPLARQIDPEKLPIVSPPTPADAAKPAAAKQGAAASPTSCVEWGSFALADLPAARKLLEPLTLGDRLSERPVEESAGQWVFIEPQGSQQGAQRKAAELKALGVDDFFVVQDQGSYRWAISLGVYRSGAAAQARLATLKAKGVTSAQIAARDAQARRVWLRVRDVDAALHARLRGAAQAIQGSELRDCG